uniref:Fibronectin type-II domain-containing protein n=1 Tax=Salvator merianae TaxID=96440 RepID=A0A8D0E4Y8_SALMN
CVHISFLLLGGWLFQCKLFHIHRVFCKCVECAVDQVWPDDVMEDPPCVFPFIYKGSIYHSCTADEQRDGTLWCASTRNYDVDKQRKFCPENYGGNSNGQPCFFPYVYKGNTYYTCNKKSEAQNRYWCATTGSYDKDKKWSYCADTSTYVAGLVPEPCKFPFTFEGKTYTACTTDGTSTGRLWCSVTSNYDKDRKWIYCEPSGKRDRSRGLGIT